MEQKIYQKEINVAVTLLLSLWFKLDSVIEYGIEDIQRFAVVSCALLLAVLLVMALWLLFTDYKKLWAIMKGIFKSDVFDHVSWIAFLMPIVCIEEYSGYFALASWTFGDIVLLAATLKSPQRENG